MSYETVTFDVRPNGIATMTLNRPKTAELFQPDDVQGMERHHQPLRL